MENEIIESLNDLKLGETISNMSDPKRDEFFSILKKDIDKILDLDAFDLVPEIDSKASIFLLILLYQKLKHSLDKKSDLENKLEVEAILVSELQETVKHMKETITGYEITISCLKGVLDSNLEMGKEGKKKNEEGQDLKTFISSAKTILNQKDAYIARLSREIAELKSEENERKKRESSVRIKIEKKFKNMKENLHNMTEFVRDGQMENTNLIKRVETLRSELFEPGRKIKKETVRTNSVGVSKLPSDGDLEDFFLGIIGRNPQVPPRCLRDGIHILDNL